MLIKASSGGIPGLQLRRNGLRHRRLGVQDLWLLSRPRLAWLSDARVYGTSGVWCYTRLHRAVLALALKALAAAVRSSQRWECEQGLVVEREDVQRCSVVWTPNP